MFRAETFSILTAGPFTLALHITARGADRLAYGAPEPSLHTDQEQQEGQQGGGHDADGLLVGID